MATVGSMFGTGGVAADRARVLVAVGASVAVFALAALASSSGSVTPFVEGTGGLRIQRDATVTTTPQQPSQTSIPEQGDGTGDSAIFELIVRLALVLAMLLAAVIILQILAKLLRELHFAPRRRRLEGPWDMAQPTGHEELAEVLDEGLRALETGDVTDAIIACWVKLEEAAADAGVARDPAETAFELTTRVLHRHAVSVDAIEALLDLYREARYSEHGMADESRAEAQAALARVRADLEASVVAVP